MYSVGCRSAGRHSGPGMAAAPGGPSAATGPFQ